MPPQTLSRGMNGSDVEHLQKGLSAKGYEVSVNGNFDEATENAVKAFQKDNNVTVDGVVGAETGRSLGDRPQN